MINTESNVKVNVVVSTDADLRLLDNVLDTLHSRDAEITIQLTGSRPSGDLQSQISQWVTAVYARSE
jgi:molybdenum cofactor biosynthesis enzyme MoaA